MRKCRYPSLGSPQLLSHTVNPHPQYITVWHLTYVNTHTHTHTMWRSMKTASALQQNNNPPLTTTYVHCTYIWNVCAKKLFNAIWRCYNTLLAFTCLLRAVKMCEWDTNKDNSIVFGWSSKKQKKKNNNNEWKMHESNAKAAFVLRLHNAQLS